MFPAAAHHENRLIPSTVYSSAVAGFSTAQLHRITHTTREHDDPDEPGDSQDYLAAPHRRLRIANLSDNEFDMLCPEPARPNWTTKLAAHDRGDVMTAIALKSNNYRLRNQPAQTSGRHQPTQPPRHFKPAALLAAAANKSSCRWRCRPQPPNKSKSLKRRAVATLGSSGFELLTALNAGHPDANRSVQQAR